MLADTGSFVETARRLGLAQSTVSLRLKRLEETLGAALIERSHAGCTLTARGATILPHANALLRSAERFVAAADSEQITIGCSGNIASYYITEDLKRFLEADHPGIKWDIKVATNPELEGLLSTGAIDLAAMEWPVNDAHIEVRPWRTEPMVVIVPNSHALARVRTISTDDLLELELIGGEPGSGTGTLLRKILGKRAAKLKITHNLQNTEAVKSAVRVGLGCSIVLAGAVREEAAAGRFVMLTLNDAKLEKMLYIALQSGQPRGALSVRLAEFLSS
jgi:DNA-binding transcriptional LysR family regulator